MPRKRGNGEGAIYKRTIRGQDYYIVEVTIDTDDNGKRIKKTSSAKTHTEAVEKLKQMQADAKNGSLIKTTHTTLYQWLEDFLDTYKRDNIKPTTFDSYKKLISCHIENSSMGKKQLQKLTPTDIQRFLKQFQQSNKRETARKLLLIFNMALRKAAQIGILTKNVAEYVELPKSVSNAAVAVLTVEEIASLKKAAEEINTAEEAKIAAIRKNRRKTANPTKTIVRNHLAEAVCLALDTGIRRGELLGLTWSDIDLEQGKLYIRRNVVETSIGKLIQTPKTDDSNRVIQLLPETIDMLTKLKQNSTHEYVFCQQDGQPRSPRHFSKLYTQVCEKAGIDNSKFHTLRHTHATEALESGMDAKVVSERLGHADIRTTFNIYVHPSEEFHKSELTKIQNRRMRGIATSVHTLSPA